MSTPQLREYVQTLDTDTSVQIMKDYAELEQTGVLVPGSALKNAIDALTPDTGYTGPRVPDTLLAVFVAMEVFRGFALCYMDLLD